MSAALPLVRFDQVVARMGGSTVFSGLSFSLHAGEHLALMGPNGAGKSTLLRLMQADLRPAQDTQSRIFWGFEGKEDPSALCARRHVRLVSPEQQRMYARQRWNISGEEAVLSGLDNAAMIYGEISGSHYREAARLAEAAHASQLLDMRVPAMSQGQLRLILILRALMGRPALLLLDEPFDGLDAAVREHAARCIRIAADQGSTLVLTAHRREDIPLFITRAVELRDGALIRRRLEPPISGKDAGPLLPGTAVPPAATPAALPDSSSERLPAAIPAAPSCAPPEHRPSLLRLSHVDVFIERKQVLFDVNWTVQRAEQWIVSGPNGSGKSTLLRLLYGEEFAAWGGDVLWHEKTRPPLDVLRAGIGYVSDKLQHAYDDDLPAAEVIISGLRGSIGLYHEPEKHEQALARKWLGLMGIERAAAFPFHTLSSGTARRVLLARALAGAPPVLLLDEPCSGLDPESRALFLNALPQLAAQGVTIVHVSHHTEDKTAFFTHELRLEQGRVLYAGPR